VDQGNIALLQRRTGEGSHYCNGGGRVDILHRLGCGGIVSTAGRVVSLSFHRHEPESETRAMPTGALYDRCW
jgi:hypothetical protein